MTKAQTDGQTIATPIATTTSVSRWDSWNRNTLSKRQNPRSHCTDGDVGESTDEGYGGHHPEDRYCLRLTEEARNSGCAEEDEGSNGNATDGLDRPRRIYGIVHDLGPLHESLPKACLAEDFRNPSVIKAIPINPKSVVVRRRPRMMTRTICDARMVERMRNAHAPATATLDPRLVPGPRSREISDRIRLYRPKKSTSINDAVGVGSASRAYAASRSQPQGA